MKLKGHGTVPRYNQGCKCRLCKTANTERAREYRRKRGSYADVRGPLETAANADLLSQPIDHDGFWERVRAESAKRDLARKAVL